MSLFEVSQIERASLRIAHVLNARATPGDEGWHLRERLGRHARLCARGGSSDFRVTEAVIRLARGQADVGGSFELQQFKIAADRETATMQTSRERRSSSRPGHQCVTISIAVN